ncbi:MAG: nucleotide sugar dehydrogenase [Deltaproteobacteria bacterium]|nr:nucleotide sugar dehydrogenase [Deltaproteobacteria bacterium]
MKRSPAKTEAFHKNAQQLKELLLQKQAKVGVIGLGYVGLPLSMAFADGGYSVLGFDNNPSKVETLMKGVSYIQDVPTADVAKNLNAKKFVAFPNFAKLKECDVVVVCVPTPLSKTKDPDMSYIIGALSKIEANLRAGQLIILESTTYPGTTREVMLPHLEKAGRVAGGKDFVCGEDFFLAFSPERVDPGNQKYNVYNTPKVVGGVTEACGELASIFYSNVMEKVIRVSSPESAEMVKLLENTFRQVNIGLVNEVAIMCEKLKIDCWEVIEAAATKPFGFMPFYPGPGLGGHCIPIDPSYLSWKLRSLNYTARFIELANTVNSSMPEFCVEKISLALNEDSKAIKGSKILVMGVSYKKDIDDMRESPALDVIHLLQRRGAKVDYYDSFVPHLDWDGINMKSVAWNTNLSSNYDLVIITTDHTNVDYKSLLDNSVRIVDTRNALKDFRDERITKL